MLSRPVPAPAQPYPICPSPCSSPSIPGALLMSGGEVSFADCTLEHNTASSSGGVPASQYSKRSSLPTHGCLSLAGRCFLIVSETSRPKMAGAMHINGGTVRLMNRSLVRQNSAPGGSAAVSVSNGATLQYSLPAPAGRYINCNVKCYGTEPSQSVTGPNAIDDDYPSACPPGRLIGTTNRSQLNPSCQGPCPAGEQAP
jgi:hypothetical protein